MSSFDIDPSANAPIQSITPTPTTEQSYPQPAPSPDPIRQSLTDFDTQSAQINTSPDLTARQQTAITLLIAGGTITSVAAKLHITRATLHNWKHNPLFLAELNRRQHEVNRAADARLRLLMLQASQFALDSLQTKHDEDRFRHAFRLLTILRPYHPIMNQPEPPMPDAAEDITPKLIE